MDNAQPGDTIIAKGRHGSRVDRRLQNFAGYLSANPADFFARERGTTSAVAWRGKTPDGKDAVIYRIAWPNHRPDVTVTRIQVWRANPASSEWLRQI